MLIDVAVRGRLRVWHQQFLVPAGTRVAGAPTSGLLGEAMCDGTSGRVLSPAFRGRASTPLRIAVSGPGRVTVTVARVGGRVVYRRVIVARRRTVVVSVASRRLARGVYGVTVAAVHSRLPAPVRLIALAL
jgi:hypothetical protein